MSVSAPEIEETALQIKRILDSPLFQNSEASRQLLTFLGQWSVDHPGQHVKETEVALSVFRRRLESFDSQNDSVVRVQMARLRAKLLEYYATYGQSDDVIIDIPKGSYLIVSSYRLAAAPPADVQPELEKLLKASGDLPPPAPAIAKTNWHVSTRLKAAAALAIGLALGCAITLSLVGLKSPGIPPRIRQFWSQAIPSGTPSLVVFSNPRLAGTLATEGLHYFREGLDSKDPQSENLSYAGAADAKSVGELIHLFDGFSQPLQIESGAHLSWDEAKESNLIFIGRPEQNPALHELPRLREFYFKFETGIVNAHPRAGEQASYACSNRPYTVDYAVIALIRGLSPSHNTLILAGATTYGSQAAAEFVSRERSVNELLNRLGVKSGGRIPYFEALLKVRINNETPVWSELIASRLRSADDWSWQEPAPDER